VAKAYKDSLAECHLHARLRFEEGHRSNLCIVFQRFVTEPEVVGKRQDRRSFNPDPSDLGVVERWGDEPMLIGVVEVSSPAKGSDNEVIPSVIRLRRIDEVANGLRESLDSVLPVCPLGVVVGDRELKTPLVGGRIAPALCDSDAIDGVIEGRANAVDAIAREQAPANEVRFWTQAKIENVLSTFILQLNNEGIRSASGSFVLT
jgi:hypothetical protein